MVVRHISLTSCNITNPRGLCAHPVLIRFRSRITTCLSDLVLFDILLLESGIHYLSASANLSHFLKTFYFQSAYLISAAHSQSAR